jgi:hypothetical protein
MGGTRSIATRVELSDITLPKEDWKPIEDGLFMISSLGRIYSNVSKHMVSVKPTKSTGYVNVPLGKRIKGQDTKISYRRTFRVHRLVAQAFIPNPYNKTEVNHINKNRSDNRVENLEWSTAWENTQHKIGVKPWHGDQGRIVYRPDSLGRRRLQGFSEKIIPMIHKMVSLN